MGAIGQLIMKKLLILFLLISCVSFGALPKVWAPGENVKGFPDVNNDFGYILTLIEEINEEIASSSYSTLGSLNDTDIASATDRQVLTYEASSSLWIPGAAGSGGSVDTATITAAIGSNTTDIGVNTDNIALNVATLSALQISVDNAWTEIYSNDSDIASLAIDISSLTAAIAAIPKEGNLWTASGTTQIYATQSVGIGTSTPDVNYKLQVVGDTKVDNLCVQHNGAVYNTDFPNNRIKFTKYGIYAYDFNSAPIFNCDATTFNPIADITLSSAK
ncbi:hypothetical protein DRJ22_06165, partial [Candidatus Woesearchaeota archaeon]